jgi:hypothetical protein
VRKNWWLVLALISISSLYYFSNYQPEKTKSVVEEIKPATENTEKKENPAPVETKTESPVDTKLSAFNERTYQALSSLPKRKAMAKSAVHQTPPEVVQAAIKIGEITDAWKQDADLREPAFQFYSRCADQIDGMPSIRAVCFSRARELSLELGQDLKLDVPKEVLDLVEE